MKTQENLTKINIGIASEDLQSQRKFINKLEKEGFDFGLIISDAFIRGMRDLGYKSTGTSLDELTDNSIQAEASKIEIGFAFDPGNKARKKPDKIYVIDNGHGMDPEMIRVAAIWGGTHREDDRNGFGRYGYGLPSACVSMGKRFIVYSKTEDGDWHKVVLDVDAIGEGKYLDENGKVTIPPAEKAKLPGFVLVKIGNNFKNFTHGTIVVVEKLDRIDYKTVKSLKDFLLKHFGVVYRNFLKQVKLLVDDTTVDAIDPLFITPGLRYFDEDDDKAKVLPEINIAVKDKDNSESKGNIKVRFSYMPPTFLRVPEDKLKKKGKNNNRFQIRKEYNGLIILRAGRQIDVVNSKCPWTTFQNNDRYIGIEVDFPPILDEHFSITTSKQQVVLKEGLWKKLEDAGVYKSIADMRNKYEEDATEIKKKREEGQGPEKRPSEQAMEEAQKFLQTTKKPETTEQQRIQKETLDEVIKERVESTGRPVKAIQEELDFETKTYPYKVLFEEVQAGPFYRIRQVGGQMSIYINKSHRFYSDIYMFHKSTPWFRYTLEVLLFVLGDCELSALDDRKLFYMTEKIEWSRKLSVVLDRLGQWDESDDQKNVEDEMAEAQFAEEKRNKN